MKKRRKMRRLRPDGGIDMKDRVKRLLAVIMLMMFAMCTAAFADGETEAAAEADATTTAVDQVSSAKAWSAGISIGIVAAAGAVAMAITIATAIKGIARQPEADGKIRTSMMLGLVFIETAIIYALIVAILIIFVL